VVLLVVAVLSVAVGLVGFRVVRHWPTADPALRASEAASSAPAADQRAGRRRRGSRGGVLETS
jgi:hypothetical protein